MNKLEEPFNILMGIIKAQLHIQLEGEINCVTISNMKSRLSLLESLYLEKIELKDDSENN